MKQIQIHKHTRFELLAKKRKLTLELWSLLFHPRKVFLLIYYDLEFVKEKKKIENGKIVIQSFTVCLHLKCHLH